MGLAWVAAATGAVLVLLGALPALQLRHPIAAMATAFVPYGVLAWLVVTLVVLTSRSWRVRAVALLTIPLLALQVAWTRPYWPREAATAGPPSGATLTVMTLSTYYGRADAAQLAAEAARARPDVVVLTEVTEDGHGRPAGDGVGRDVPEPRGGGRTGVDVGGHDGLLAVAAGTARGTRHER